MNRKSSARMRVGAISVVLVLAYIPNRLVAQDVLLDPAKMPRIATIDERFQSYNIEMVEVIGGRFWKPYSSHATNASTTQPSGSTPAGMDPELYQYRPPVDQRLVELSSFRQRAARPRKPEEDSCCRCQRANTRPSCENQIAERKKNVSSV